MRFSSRQGFTLIELSIVLLVFALLIAGTLASLAQSARIADQATLQTEVDAIERALINFRRANNRLPCPADGGIQIGDSNGYFGMEASASGDCYTTGAIRANRSDGSNTVMGVIPVRALDLPDQYMFDPWGGRFTYVVDNRMTAPSAFINHPVTDTAIGSIIVQDGVGGTRATSAIALIMSHGPDGHGAYQVSGMRKASGSDNPAEMQNCHCNSNASPTPFNNTFVQMLPTSPYSDLRNVYDDVNRFYLRADMLSAAEEGYR